MGEILIALGSNLGNCAQNLQKSIHLMQEKISLTHQSTVIKTAPMYIIGQPDFLNQVVVGQTSLNIQDVFEFLKNIERSLDRQSTYRYGPREIDIDILAYDQIIIDTLELCIPHMHLYERAFVLEPLVEIYPDWICPRTGKTASQLLRELQSISEDAPILNEMSGF